MIFHLPWMLAWIESFSEDWLELIISRMLKWWFRGQELRAVLFLSPLWEQHFRLSIQTMSLPATSLKHISTLSISFNPLSTSKGSRSLRLLLSRIPSTPPAGINLPQMITKTVDSDKSIKVDVTYSDKNRVVLTNKDILGLGIEDLIRKVSCKEGILLEEFGSWVEVLWKSCGSIFAIESGFTPERWFSTRCGLYTSSERVNRAAARWSRFLSEEVLHTSGYLLLLTVSESRMIYIVLLTPYGTSGG